ncbi:hypothetical protein KRP22_006087 [Phytophthora ramorum]|nr:hypothetical protein KRP22_2782 [Phytophthora ramorum]KAH7509336.1 hypothetical protein KRP22_837 [Phytophthora ramorum]
MLVTTTRTTAPSSTRIKSRTSGEGTHCASSLSFSPRTSGTHDTSSQRVTMTEPPSVVLQAVKEFQALGPFELVPPRPKETS